MIGKEYIVKEKENEERAIFIKNEGKITTYTLDAPYHGIEIVATDEYHLQNALQLIRAYVTAKINATQIVQVLNRRHHIQAKLAP